MSPLVSTYSVLMNAYLGNREPDIKNPWLTAEKRDKNECAVIDFRDFVNFFVHLRRTRLR